MTKNFSPKTPVESGFVAGSLAKIARLEYIVHKVHRTQHLLRESMPAAYLQETNEYIEVKKIFCIGRNYAEHAKEMSAAVPEAPVFFLKPATAIIPDGGTIIIPSISRELHHEVEMTILIGTGGRNISRSSAFQHIAGYGIGLDMTLRDVQSEAKKKGLPWTLSKGFDTSAPLSGFYPAAKVTDAHNLEVTLAVNGSTRQHSNTKNFIFKIDELIAYISQFFTFERGDVIFTGTPEGVAQTTAGDTLNALLSHPGKEPLASLTVSVQ